MKRAVIYARFSTEHQTEKSIDDQVELCRRHAARQGYSVVEIFRDEACSGTSILGRNGLEGLLRKAASRSFDVVLVESLDRLSRDPGDLHQIHKNFDFLDISIESLQQGKADSIDVAVHSIYNSIFISNVRAQVRRGMAGLWRD